MQKFGLDSLQSRKATALELEVLKEKASALGIAGARLQKSLDQYYLEARKGWPSANQEHFLEKISEGLTELIIQRELVGLVHDNMTWVIDNYDIPAPVLKQVGLQIDE